MRARLRRILNDKNFGDILKGGTIVFLLKVMSSVITMLLTVLITRKLGIAESGYYFFIISFLMFSTSLISCGLYNSTLKEIAINSENSFVSNFMTRAFIIFIVSSLSISLLVFCLNYVAVKFGYKHEIVSEYYGTLILLMLPFSLVLLFSNYFQALRKLISGMLMFHLGYQLLLLMLMFFLSINTLDELLVYLEASLAVLLVYSFFYYFKRSDSLRLNSSRTYSAMFAVSLPMMVSHVVSQLNNFSAQVFLSVFSGAEDISLFSVSLRVAMLVSFLVMAVNRVAAPKFAKLFAENRLDELRDVVLFSNRLLLAFSTPLLIVIILFGHKILALFGSEYIEAYPILIILTFGQFISSVTGNIGFLLQMTGLEAALRNNILVATAISIISGFFLVPLYGLTGGALMTFISLVSVNMLSCYKAHKTLGINPLRFWR